VLARVWGRDAEETLGALLRADTIEAHLERVRQAELRYRASHADTVASLAALGREAVPKATKPQDAP
jgi:hypothetical protein